MSTTTPTPIRDTTVVRNFRGGDTATFLHPMNETLGMSITPAAFHALQTFYKYTALRDPTVGELRLLDALDRDKTPKPRRITVSELTTQSPAIARTWADMMEKWGDLHGADHVIRGGQAATPPCSLMDALSLTGRYIRRTEEPSEGDTRLLTTPAQEAVASAEGYAPVARVIVGEGSCTLWSRGIIPAEELPCRTGDFLLYLSKVTPDQVQALVAEEAKKTRTEIAAIRAVAEESLLATVLDMCPAADLHIGRLIPEGGDPHTLPLALLCGAPRVKPDGTCGYILRIPLRQVQSFNQTLTGMGLSAIVLGQVRTGGNVVMLLNDEEGKRELPAVTLPAEMLTEAMGNKPCVMAPEAADTAIPTPLFPTLCRLPSVVQSESGLTPDGRETVALNIHEGRILRIPEADTLMTALTATVCHPHSGFSVAADTVAASAKLLEEGGISPDRIRLSVAMTVSDPDWMRKGEVLAAICGVYCAAAQLALPVEDPTITMGASEAPLRLTVIAHAVDHEFCEENARLDDRQWHTSPYSGESSKAAPAFLLPVLRRSYEPCLKALSAGLNRDMTATCVIRPLAMDQVKDEESGTVRYTLHPDSQQQLVAKLGEPLTPIFSLNEGDTRLLLSHPAVEKAIRARLERGGTVLVLGESCKPFAELGLLPPCLLHLKAIPPAGGQATVTYSFPAEPSTRLLRVHPLSPMDPASHPDRPMLELRLPDGQVIPDGFIGCEGQVLGLLNGVDTALLSRVRASRFTF